MVNHVFSQPMKLVCLAMMVLMALAISTTSGSAQPTSPPALEKPQFQLPGALDSPVTLTGLLTWHVDKTRKQILSDVIALPDDAFAKDMAIPSFGYTRDVIWYRLDFSVQEKVTERPYLELQPSYLNFIDVVLIGKGQNEPFWRSNMGDNTPASLRPYGGPAHVTALPFLDAGDYRMFIRVQSNSTNFMRIKLWPQTDLITALTVRSLAVNVFFGLVVTLGLAYLILGIVARDLAVMLYGIWVFTIGTVVAIVAGIVLSEIRPEITWLNDFLLGEINIISHAVTAFLWFYIVDIKKHHPFIYKVCCAYALFILMFLVGGAGDLYTVFGSYIVPSHSLFMIIMSLYLVRRLFDDARNWLTWAYLFILALPTGPAVMLQLAHSGLIEATPLRLELHQFSALFHMIAMGIVMAVRLAHMDRESNSISRKAEETTTLVEEQRNLISMLSHEFRTPLAVIQRSSEMLMLRLQGRTGDVSNRLERIQLQARKLARLVDIFLSKDGIDRHEFSLARELTPLSRFMQEFVANTTREDAKILVNEDNTQDLEVFIDETLIGLAITNLIETSRRFAHGRPIQIELHRHSNLLVEIAIPCKGEGLDDDEIRLIGDALFRREMEAKSLRNALGLHISQRIVDAHGGSIKLRDRGDNGIELCLLLSCEEIGVAKA
ncbi:sensor histidine kinase [Thalassospira lucentensis]|uniref:sensor histidine kinase n=1 Tax=Thalassospira lucentensis TaxID=168935 RepID=UPI003D2EED06